MKLTLLSDGTPHGMKVVDATTGDAVEDVTAMEVVRRVGDAYCFELKVTVRVEQEIEFGIIGDPVLVPSRFKIVKADGQA